MDNKDRIILLYISGVPGLGQFYKGQSEKGWRHLICWMVLLGFGIFGLGFLSPKRWGGAGGVLEIVDLVLLVGLSAYSFLDAVFVDGPSTGASEMSEEEKSVLTRRLREDARDQIGYVPDLAQRNPEGFKRKVKGTPDFKPLPPLEDEGSSRTDPMGRDR